ncbi:MAG: FHA domain-containing protein [Spirochaetes bacterium]|nr:FHA domain-containing protein [Spirochaetota bacterium]
MIFARGSLIYLFLCYYMTMEWNIEIKDIISNKSKFYTFNKKKITLGRGSNNDIVIHNKYISDHHLSLWYQDHRYFVQDEQSSNGSEINLHYKWKELKKESTAHLPLQLKLAKAVIMVVQTNESQIITIKEIEHEEAIMVLDLCDSTKMSFQNDKIAFHLKQRLSNISKPILYKNGVNFFKSTGDGFLATFPTTVRAFNAACRILRSINKRNQVSPNASIHVRIALHRGKTYIIDPVSDDIHGKDINITFRLEGLTKKALEKQSRKFCESDRILCTKYFVEDYEKKSRRKTRAFTYIGLAKMRGIKEKLEVFQAIWKRESKKNKE